MALKFPGTSITKLDGAPYRQLTKHQVIPLPLGQVFEFFSVASNLNKLTPPYVGFQIKTPEPIKMEAGTEIDYAIKLNGIPMLWRTEITEWVHNKRFVDVQLIGPYYYWIHEHEFRAIDKFTTEMIDTVSYCAKGGPLKAALHKAYVDRSVEKIFDYRKQAVEQLLGPELVS